LALEWVLPVVDGEEVGGDELDLVVGEGEVLQPINICRLYSAGIHKPSMGVKLRGFEKDFSQILPLKCRK
jgi:hypothetical protein